MTGRRPRFNSVTVVVCDSVGCGGAPDAAAFGDEGANTLAHVIEHAGIELPNLARLGIDRVPGVPALGSGVPIAAHGRMFARAPAKDTMLGHWELMGVVAEKPFPVYPNGFPTDVIDEFKRLTGRGVLGNRAVSGTVVLEQLGEEHLLTGKPIVYTSGDSVFQVAAHEQVIEVAELYAMCRSAREMLRGPHAVGRVIARPFVGTATDGFTRTPRRRDFPLPAPAQTALDHLQAAGVTTHAIGKVNDIFAGRGIDTYEKADSNAAGIEATRRALAAPPASFVFVNLVDFDSKFGHRNDPQGYGRALVELDDAIPAWLDALPDDGLLILTADHGNDPTWPGTDHTRECVPLLAYGRRVVPVDLGTRASFADLGATVLEVFAAPGDLAGKSFLPEIS